MYWLYVGDAEGFRAVPNAAVAELPTSLIELGDLNLHECAAARRMLESDKYGGCAFDACASGAKLPLDRIREFATDFLSHSSRLDGVKRQLSDLDQSKQYFLVACEL